MKNDFQIILLNKNSKFNLSFSLNKNIIFILIICFIALIGFSSWGIFRIIKPHKTQELIKQNISLKHNTINLLSALIKNDSIDSTMLNNYKINHNLSNLIPNNLPVKGIVTKGLENKKGHHGIDIAATLNSNVNPAQEGLVVFAGELDHYGKTIIISHPNNYFTLYSHLSTLKVKQRDYVKIGQNIGLIGQSGKSDAPHLHFEIWKNHLIIDPRNLIKEYEEKDVSIK